MPSLAYGEWTSDRAARINELVAAHTAVGGVGPGRRWRTTQLNLALALRLAAEFQGFARALHDECCDFICGESITSGSPFYQYLRSAMSDSRSLDRGNANPGNLGIDFLVLGLGLWPALTAKYGRKTKRWNDALDELNTARNGIAHDDQAKFSKLPSSKYPITLTVIKDWRKSLNDLADGMDFVTGEYLERMTGGTKPW